MIEMISLAAKSGTKYRVVAVYQAAQYSSPVISSVLVHLFAWPSSSSGYQRLSDDGGRDQRHVDDPEDMSQYS